VSFWRFNYNQHDQAIFDDEPTRYHEKIRPGQAQMICASFSPGGIFFCVGSADHHVRVYQLNGEEPRRILEEEAHGDRVDSIQWCNTPDKLRFVSGSKDGTARIWTYRGRRWTTLVLNMRTGDNTEPASASTNAPTASSSSSRAPSAPVNSQQASAERVTMVAWSLDDSLVITAVSDRTLRLWDAHKGALRRTLSGHEDEVFVLEPHPFARNLLLSAAHDGQIIVWDLDEGRALFKHKNVVEDLGGHGAVYDAKWTPDGLTVCATDSHGHVLFLGHGSAERYNKLPVELFFHTDYRPLLRDSFHYVVDEQTQVPPHLLPPPFLVDSEGSPYPGYIQVSLLNNKPVFSFRSFTPLFMYRFMSPDENEWVKGKPCFRWTSNREIINKNKSNVNVKMDENGEVKGEVKFKVSYSMDRLNFWLQELRVFLFHQDPYKGLWQGRQHCPR